MRRKTKKKRMDVIELKKLYESSVCNLAKYVENCIKLELEKAVGVDEVMQDHWADALQCPALRSDNNVKECLQFLEKASEAIKDAIVQDEALSKHFNIFEVEAPLIAKMLMGYIGFEVDKKLVECSRKVKKTADRILAKKKKKLSRVECEKLTREFLDAIIPMTEKYGYYLTDDGKMLELNGMYLETWFLNRCKTE